MPMVAKPLYELPTFAILFLCVCVCVCELPKASGPFSAPLEDCAMVVRPLAYREVPMKLKP
jgi:hypothetical protein